MNWIDVFLAVAVVGNIAGGLFSWRIAWRLQRDLRAVAALNVLLSHIARKQFETAAMASHGWRAWAGTIGTIHVQFVSGQDEDATEAEDG